MTAQTISQYVEQPFEEDTLKCLEEAVRLSPNHGLAYARLAKRILEQGVSKKNPSALVEADFYSRFAARLAPGNAEVTRIRSEICQPVESKAAAK